MDLGKIIITILILWVYFSTFECVLGLWYKKKSNFFSTSISTINMLNAIAAFVGLYLFLYAGFEKALFFIPENWGYYNYHIDFDGVWVPAKETYSYYLSIVSAFWICVNIENNKIIIKK